MCEHYGSVAEIDTTCSYTYDYSKCMCMYVDRCAVMGS